MLCFHIPILSRDVYFKVEKAHTSVMILEHRSKGRDTCIICEERIGTIRTRDGMVCPACMPRDLLSLASGLSESRIMSFRRAHRDYISCESSENSTRSHTTDSRRSMAITQSDDVILSDELNAMIRESVCVDIVVSFIRMSGLSLLLDSLTAFSKNGRLRVITTAYTGATEYEALAELFSLQNTEVRMELSADMSRLHAKCFIFRNAEGRETAYVGSANISRTALTSGEEWVVKLRGCDVPEVLNDLHRGFEALWNSSGIKPVDTRNRAEIEAALESRGM